MCGARMGVSAMLRLGQASMLMLALAGLSGCLGGGKAKDDTFALSAMPEIAGPAARNKQILVPEPAALKALDSEQIVIRVTPSEIQYLAQARWSDRLPKMVQAKLVEAYENSGKLGGVGKPGEGLAIDFQIVSDIRAFQIETSGGDHAHVEISVKVLNDRNGSVKAQHVFSAEAPVSGAGNPAFIAALDAAFAKVTADIVGWTLKSI
jgi:cholesterol transport system auxiliary component